MIETHENQRGTLTPAPRRSQRERALCTAYGRRTLDEPLLTVIVPVYNEVDTINELLERVLAAPLVLGGFANEREQQIYKQIVVVDDGSTDGTARELDRWRPQVVVIMHSTNCGKGAAIRSALTFARGHFTLIQDADLEYDPRDYAQLIQPLLVAEADAIYGSRYLENCRLWSVCRLGVSLLNRIVQWLYGTRITDEATCYKVFRTEDLCAMDLQCDRFEFCPEVTAKACRMGFRILEVPIRYSPRTNAQGKKIRWRDGWTAAKTLWRWRKWQPTGRKASPSVKHL